jgi:predicted nucleotidyltransferase
MIKEKLKNQLRDHLEKQDNIIFAYIFGSFVQKEHFRDIDTALFFESEPGLLALGRLQVELEQVCKENVDLVILNGLYTKKPAFSHEIVTKGELLFSRTPEIQLNYKRDAMLRYFDTKRLRQMMDKAFQKRLETGQFGQRNYA